ncbi:type II 3-dehydroquinate dehydratase [Haloplasma contractile]|uniref:3-dehydroquinate dehydratase n=1 Tax=Haloplasma contractile SSD-17B TaxID=1033810 RepID=U2EGN6_9MOLU|nr:type II 3-dehydroquinate dehydratase [Haloplasma contractile]ERJ13781.1 3-dehydroquinate dehydratase protein [Haloplasma contractile SSD-17B]
MNIHVINGPNLNMLGIREPEIYGKETYRDLVYKISEHAKTHNLTVTFTQSNHEGVLIDAIQNCYYEKVDALIINPAAYTHYSIAIRDALKILDIPIIEVHLSDIMNREPYRKNNMISDCVTFTISGKGTEGYIEAMDYLITVTNKVETDGEPELNQV